LENRQRQSEFSVFELKV
jgi:Kinesin motor domain